MSSPILNFAPKIDPEAPAWLRQHLSLIYQKLGNHAQAMSLLAQKPSSSTTSNTTIEETVNATSGGGGVTPQNSPAVASEWLNSYDSSIGVFGLAQPGFSDIAGVAQVSQGGTGTATPSLVAGANVAISGSFPNQTISASTSGLSVTITTAKLTTGGANGSMTFVNGLLTAQVQAT